MFILFALSGMVQAGSVLVLGDSISAGYGLEKTSQGWVALLEQKLKPRAVAVVNASISGETSAGGLARVNDLLKHHGPSVVIVELGGNDGLRGLSPGQMKSNLSEIITRAKAAKARVLLLGMKIPPNYGKRYADLFQKVYPELADQYGVTWVPFLLEGVGGHEQLMQADGLHPNLEAQPLLMAAVWRKLEPMLEK
ncbi:arylesterase [Methylomagnum sp.]